MEAIDTHILLWGQYRRDDTNRPDMVDRCDWLLQNLKSRRITIMVPSLVLAEYLVNFSAEEQVAQREVISKNFFIAPFDALAASITAELFDKKLMESIQQGSQLTRQAVKSDLKIIATTIAHKAVRFYTDDNHFVSLANGKIIVSSIPEIPSEQEGLFKE